MTPRQLAALSYFNERKEAVRDVRLLNVTRLAFAGNKKALKAFMKELGLEK